MKVHGTGNCSLVESHSCIVCKCPSPKFMLWSTGLRLSVVLVPWLPSVMAPLGQEHYPKTTVGQLAMVPMALLLPRFWMAALGFR